MCERVGSSRRGGAWCMELCATRKRNVKSPQQYNYLFNKKSMGRLWKDRGGVGGGQEQSYDTGY